MFGATGHVRRSRLFLRSYLLACTRPKLAALIAGPALQFSTTGA
jgi:hypothetical protein